MSETDEKRRYKVQREYKGRFVLAYVKDHPNALITIDEVAEAVQWSNDSTSAALNRFTREIPGFQRIERGVYRYDPSVVPEPDLKLGERDMCMAFVAEGTRGLMMRDMETGKHYIVTAVDF